MKSIQKHNFKLGDLYYFASELDVQQGIWGIYNCRDAQGRPCLEVWSHDFVSFGDRMAVPEEYTLARIASRDELRDFAYNMGYKRV